MIETMQDNSQNSEGNGKKANADLDIITRLQSSNSNIKIFSVVPMGVMMIIYFFTFATLIDRGMFGALAFEIITTVIFFLAIININRWPLTILRWRYRNRQPYNQLLIYMQSDDFEHPSEEIARRVEQRKNQSVIG